MFSLIVIPAPSLPRRVGRRFRRESEMPPRRCFGVHQKRPAALLTAESVDAIIATMPHLSLKERCNKKMIYARSCVPSSPLCALALPFNSPFCSFFLFRLHRPPRLPIPPSPLHLPSPSSLSLKVSETEMSGDLPLARTENKSLFSPSRASIDDPRPFAYTYLLLSNTFLILLLQVCRSSRLPCVFPHSSRRADALNVCAIRGAPLISSSRENNAPFA